MFKFGRKMYRLVVGEESVEVGEVDGVRSLYLGSSTIQSSMRVKTPYSLELPYSRGMMMFLLFAKQVQDVLVLGLGGGSVPKYIHHFLPAIKTRVVELNPQVIQIARSHFYLPDDDVRLQVVHGDGAAYLRENPETTDMLMLDIFDGQGIPPNLYAQDFFDTCRQALKPDGMMAVNLWGSDKNFDIYLQRIEQSFNYRVLVIPTGRPGNIVVFGMLRPLQERRWEVIRAKARALDAEYQLDFMGLLERLRDHNPNTNHRIVMD